MLNRLIIFSITLLLADICVLADSLLCKSISNELVQSGQMTKISLPDAQKGAAIRISNLDIKKIQAYLLLKDASIMDGADMIIKGVVIDNSGNLFNENKIVDCYRISSDDNAIIITKLPDLKENTIAPTIDSIYCIAAINPDGSIAYLTNKRLSSDDIVSVSTIPEVIPFSYETLVDDFSSNTTVKIDSLSSNITDYLKDISTQLRRGKSISPFLKITLANIAQPPNKKATLSDLEKELQENMSGIEAINEKGENLLDRKIACSTGGKLKDMIDDACSKSKMSYVRTFWGYEFFTTRPDMNKYRVLCRQEDKAIIQSISVPGALRVVPTKNISLLHEEKTNVNPQMNELNPAAGKAYLYMGATRTASFMEKLYNAFKNSEQYSSDLSKYNLTSVYKNRYVMGQSSDRDFKTGRRDDVVFKTQSERYDYGSDSNTPNQVVQLIKQRNSLDDAHAQLRYKSFEAFTEVFSKNSSIGIWLICPTCKGSGINSDMGTRNFCQKCGGLGRLKLTDTVNYINSIK